MPPDVASGAATDTGEESGVDVDESFPPAASHVPVELQNLWKQIEERGFRIQGDFDQEASGLTSIRTASPICIRTGLWICQYPRVRQAEPAILSSVFFH